MLLLLSFSFTFIHLFTNSAKHRRCENGKSHGPRPTRGTVVGVEIITIQVGDCYCTGNVIPEEQTANVKEGGKETVSCIFLKDSWELAYLEGGKRQIPGRGNRNYIGTKEHDEQEEW